ncbi:MAG: hypothetical protein B6I22_10740 [Desulfobacteraceae bacterium 4572_123]|nr:MAG: hypothetical protein B6I22_10740 [Desulfobacteraceae bacterium 4572_123]
MVKVLVSACLMGERVRYDGAIVPYNSAILNSWRDDGLIVSFCPEVAGNLPVPRSPAEIINGTGTDVFKKNIGVYTINGQDVTESFIKGAGEALRIVKEMQIKLAVLKEGSPSCGKTSINNGSFSGSKRRGKGVTTALLEKNDIAVFSENEIKKAATYLDELKTS